MALTASGADTSTLLHIFTNPVLYRHITAFQNGIPLPLYQFWALHCPAMQPEPQPEPQRQLPPLGFNYMPSGTPTLTSRGIHQLVYLAVEHGTPALLDRISKVGFYERGDPNEYDGNGFHQHHNTVLPLACEDTLLVRWVTAEKSSSAAYHAIVCNRPDTLEWCLVNGQHGAPHALWQIALDLFKDGDFGVLDVLRTHRQQEATADYFRSRNWLRQIKDVRLFQWLYDATPGPVQQTFPADMMRSAVESGDLTMVQYLNDQHGARVDGTFLFGHAYDCGHVDIMKYLVENRRDLVDSRDVRRVLLGSKPLAVRVLHECTRFASLVHEIVATHDNDYSVRHDLAPFLHHLADHDLLARGDLSISLDRLIWECFTSDSRLLDLVTMLYERGVAEATTEAMDRAAEARQWDIVQFLHMHRTDGCTTRTMDAAVAQGRLHYTIYLHEHRTEGCSPHALVTAASSGDLSLVRYVFKILRGRDDEEEVCTLRAMEMAAHKGHVEILSFLHENRSPQCVSTTTHGTDCQRHSSVVQPQDGASASLPAPLPFKWDIEIVRFLYDHYPARFGLELLPDLLLYGMFDVWMRLRESFPEQATTGLESVLFRAGQQVNLKAIRFVVHVLGHEELAHRAVDGAVEWCCDDEHAQSLRAVLLVVGQENCRLSAVHATVHAFSELKRTCHELGDIPNLKFVIRQCSEAGAKEEAIAFARTLVLDEVVDALESWTQPDKQVEMESDFPAALHPFVLDPRSSCWGVHFGLGHRDLWEPIRPSGRTVAERVILRGDPVMLQVLHDLVSAPSSAFANDPAFTLNGARVAGIRHGSLAMLTVLLERVDLPPVEPWLLEKALQYRRYTIAEWLIGNCPDGCLELNWESTATATATEDPWRCLDDCLLEWVESASASVRCALDVRGLVRRAAKLGDASALKRLRMACPEAFSDQ